MLVAHGNHHSAILNLEKAISLSEERGREGDGERGRERGGGRGRGRGSGRKEEEEQERGKEEGGGGGGGGGGRRGRGEREETDEVRGGRQKEGGVREEEIGGMQTGERGRDGEGEIKNPTEWRNERGRHNPPSQPTLTQRLSAVQYGYGVSLFHDGRYEEALEMFSAAARSCPERRECTIMRWVWLGGGFLMGRCS